MKSCPACGSELVGESTLSGMKVFACRSSSGSKGLAQSDICKGRQPLWEELTRLRKEVSQ